MGTSVVLTVYGAAALLAPFIVPDYEAAMMFVVFMGYYPIIRPSLHKIPIRLLRMLTKGLLFNTAVIAGYWVIIQFLGLSFLLDGNTGSVNMALGFMLLMGNVIFVLYDLAIQNIYRAYTHVFRKRLFGKGRRPY